MASVTDDEIAWLIELLEKEGLAEIEVEHLEEGWRVRVSRSVTAAVAVPVAATEIEAASEALPEDVVPVVAPMAGIFYRAPSPEAEPYVQEGDHVERGQVVGLIEAMKIFNEVESPVTGTIIRILVDNEQPVQANQRLLLVRIEDGT